MKKPLIAILVLLLAAVGWLYQAPRSVAKKLQNAAIAGDTVALRELVDFAVLRADLKNGFDQSMRSYLPTNPSEFQSALTGGVTSILADRLATPKGISFIFTNVSAHRPIGNEPIVTTWSAEDYNTFLIVRRRGEPAHDSMFAVLTRRGLSWQMTRVWVSDLGRPGQ